MKTPRERIDLLLGEAVAACRRNPATPCQLSSAAVRDILLILDDLEKRMAKLEKHTHRVPGLPCPYDTPTPGFDHTEPPL